MNEFIFNHAINVINTCVFITIIQLSDREKENKLI